MLADPAAGAHADRRQLAPLQPHAGEALDPLPRQPQAFQQVDHHLLQLAQVEVQIRPVALQVEHRVEHQLTRGVVGHLAAPVDAVQGKGRRLGREAQVGVAGPPTQGVAGLMLQQQQGIGAPGMVEQPLLQESLGPPAPLEAHRPAGFKKDCVEPGCHGGAYLALKQRATEAAPTR